MHHIRFSVASERSPISKLFYCEKSRNHECLKFSKKKISLLLCVSVCVGLFAKERGKRTEKCINSFFGRIYFLFIDKNWIKSSFTRFEYHHSPFLYNAENFRSHFCLNFLFKNSRLNVDCSMISIDFYEWDVDYQDFADFKEMSLNERYVKY